ncbi:MAG: hypothetical protein Q9182_001038 [Xanthomendoza sp. 2 TL-2023]
MKSIHTIIVFIAFFCLFLEAATIAESVRRRTADGGLPKPLEHRAPPRRLAQTKEMAKKDDLPKYFNEPDHESVPHYSAHYDIRYYKGIQDYSDRRDTQLHMMRAYLTFFHENHLESWLAHGTLLGWWWNGKTLPWDWDIDTQVSEPTLNYLSQHHNHTTYIYLSHHNIKRTYLLDINPASTDRERGNGDNIIDARWIDTRNGLFIDITALSETHPDDLPGVWACKNNHRYNTTDLYPMRETIFEGVVAKVPYAYDHILTEEYEAKALVLTEWEDHHWNPILKSWLPIPIPPPKSAKKASHPGGIPKKSTPKQKKAAEIWRDNFSWITD